MCIRKGGGRGVTHKRGKKERGSNGGRKKRKERAQSADGGNGGVTRIFEGLGGRTIPGNTGKVCVGVGLTNWVFGGGEGARRT